MFLKCFDISKPGELINGGVLIELFAFGIPNDTSRRNEFDIDLNALFRIHHLFVWFGNILWIPWLYRSLLKTSKETKKSGNGTRVTTLSELDPKDDKSSVRITPAHISDELYLFLRYAHWDDGEVLWNDCEGNPMNHRNDSSIDRCIGDWFCICEQREKPHIF